MSDDGYTITITVKCCKRQYDGIMKICAVKHKTMADVVRYAVDRLIEKAAKGNLLSIPEETAEDAASRIKADVDRLLLLSKKSPRDT